MVCYLDRVAGFECAQREIKNFSPLDDLRSFADVSSSCDNVLPCKIRQALAYLIFDLVASLSLRENGMKVIALNHHQFDEHLNLLDTMYRLRRRIFKDRLDWSVSTSGDLEIDVYDVLNPTYLLVMQNAIEVVGCVRLLPTTGPTMLADTFSVLLDGRQPPRSPRILESSRFCIDTQRANELAENGLRRATFILFAAMLECLRFSNANSIVTVTDVRMERILRRAGWPLDRIAPPQRVGQTTALAGFLYESEGALAAMYQNAGVTGPVLVEPGMLPAAA